MPDPTAPASPDPDPNPPATAPPRRWRHAELRARGDRRLALILATAGLLLVGVGLLALAGWFRPLGRPALVIMGGPAAGPGSLPRWGGDLAALRRLAGFALVAVEPNAIEAGLAAVDAAAATGPLVVYLSGRGWVDPADPAWAEGAEGGPPTVHLFEPAGPSLDGLLARVADRRATPRLVLLDIHPPPDDPRAGGLLAESVGVAVQRIAARRVAEAATTAAGAAPLSILVSAEAGQRPLATDALGRSAFGYYIEQGLGGAADASGDGRIAARELAAYARDRVGRWAREVRGQPQSPTLHEAEDFDLVLAPRPPSPPADLPKEAPTYPAWLDAAWRERDALAAAGAAREAPRPLGQFEAAILQAEREWRGGDDAGQVRPQLIEALDALRGRIAATRTFPRPPPRSLAQAAAYGPPADPEIAAAVAAAYAARPRPEPDAKPGAFEAAEARAIAQFYDPAKLKLRSEFDLAAAAFGAAVADPSPSPESIGFLAHLLAVRQPAPLYAESLGLDSLARRPRGEWRADEVRRFCRMIRDAERAQARPTALAGGTAPLDEVARLQHEAAVVFGAPGFAAAAEVDRRLLAAQAAADAASARQAPVDEARALAEEASRLLPAALPLLAVAPDLEPAWLGAVDEAAALLDALAAPPVDREAGARRDRDDRVEPLRAALAPFAPAGIAARIERATRREPPPGPDRLREVDALLATALPLADGRVALWKAGIDAERRLTAAVLGRDARDGRRVAAEAVASVRAVADRSDPSAAPATVRRLRVSGRLLALGGFAAEPGRGDALRAQEERWSGLVAALEGRRGADRARLARLVPPWENVGAIDDPARDPTRARRAAEYDDLRRWLAGRYAFEARDAGGSEFAAEAARDFERPGEPPLAVLGVDAGPVPPPLDPAHPEATLRITLRAGDAAAGRARLEVAAAGADWLELGPGSSWPPELGPPPRVGPGPFRCQVPVGAESIEVPVRVALRRGDEAPATPIPPGLIVRVGLGPRTWHRLVPLRIEPEAHQLRVALTADPAGTGPDLGGIRLRPAQGKVPAFLSVRNPGPRDRQVAVTLLDRRGPVPGAAASVAVRAGGTTRVAFGPPVGKPEDGFVDIHGPLTVRLADPERPAAAVDRAIPVGPADPADLVRLVAARFEPAGPSNGGRSRLELRVRALGALAGPPCPVELSLPPSSIPGLVSPGEGTYAGKLAKPGDEVALTVEGIKVDDREDRPGHLHLAVDGVERAIILRTRLGARQAASVPVQVTRPAVRLKVGGTGLTSAPVPVGIEVDSPPEDGRVEVALGQPEGPDGLRADAVAEVDAAPARVQLNPRGPDGALVFEATRRDLAAALDVGKVRGRRAIRARVLDGLGNVKATTTIPFVLDDRPPDRVTLVAPPRYGLKGGTVDLRAVGSVPSSGLREVVFFVGRPVDGRRPPGAAVVAGRPVDPEGTTWVASLPLGEAKVGPVEVSAEFVAGVGLARADTATLAVVEAIPVEPGKIRGTVLEGGRPQPAFEVRILDEKGAEKKKAKTDEQGRFEAEGLAPGSYEVVCEKATPPTRGSARATVRPGATEQVEVAMFRR